MKKFLVFTMMFLMVISASLFVGCQKVDFKLNFVVDGKVYSTITTNGNETIKLPDNPEKEGYVFDGWYFDNEVWKKPFTVNSFLDAPLSSDMSVYAKFDGKKEEKAIQGTQAEFIGFTDVGGNRYIKKVSNDTEFLSLGTSVKVSLTSSWILSFDIYGNNTIASKTATLSVGDNTYYVSVIADDGTMQLYTLNIRRREIYTVSFADCDANSQYVEEDSCATAPSSANRNGYTFASWDFDFSTPIIENTVVNAKWNVVTYNIEYDLNGGENNTENPSTYTIEDYIVLPTPQKIGYSFRGWYLNSSFSRYYGYKIFPGSYNDLKFYAKWTPTVYSITYELNGGENNSKNPFTYTIESGEIILYAPSKYGYTFDGWYSDDAFTEKVEKIEPEKLINKMLYAKWQSIVYSIEYELNGGENNSENPFTYTIESDDIVLGTPTMIDYDFIGWYADEAFTEKVEEIKTGTFGNKKLYAKWSSKYYLFDENKGELTGLTDYGLTCEELIIPEQLYNVTIRSIGIKAFKNCYLKKITIGNSVTNIGSHAFYGCESLASITIPNSVTNIGSHAFYGCESLASITIPNSVTSIGSYAFYGCKSLASITIPNSVASIGDYSFYYCNNLEGLIIGNGVTNIGNYAFYLCCGLNSITVPDSVLSIGDYAFYNTNTKSITIGCKLTNLGNFAFENNIWLRSIVVNDGNSTYHSNNNCLIETASKTLILGCANSIIPDDGSVTCVGDYAFCGGFFGDLIIPDSVLSIGDYAFFDCTSLTSVTIPNSVTSIGDYVFGHCTSLTSVTIPNSVTSIGDYVFGHCTSLTSVTISNSVTSIGDYVFYDCTSLTSVTISNSVTSIGDYVFGHCTSLTSVTIPNSVTSIGDYAFYDCTSLTSVTIPNSVTSIGDYVFYDCTSLTSVTIPNSVTSIGSYTFYDCTSLRSVTIPDSVTSIGSYMFYDCTSLTSITIPDSITSIGDSAFMYSGLMKIYYKGTMEEWYKIKIGSNAFAMKSISDVWLSYEGGGMGI